MASGGHIKQAELDSLREAITEGLRVQHGSVPVDYVNAGTAVQDAGARQNHAIFARRGCGKTLLLQHSSRNLKPKIKSIYLNCEDFKRHSFPNVLIEILLGVFKQLEANLSGWFGKKAKSKAIIKDVISKLRELQKAADIHDEEVRRKTSSDSTSSAEGSGGVDFNQVKLKFGAKNEANESSEIERSFQVHREKLQELDRWLPDLKDNIRNFFNITDKTDSIFIQIDDLYHLKRTDQAFVVDYIHRLCKDVPIFFKIATLRHASTLYADRDGQPIGAQERHDYQPINIDYSFGDFKRTAAQNWQIMTAFAVKSGLTEAKLAKLFKGEGFNRLVMAGGGVPRDVLSLFLEILSEVDATHGGQIGKDEVRISSRANFERKIEELKEDSKGEEQDDLLKGIYLIRQFCLEKQTNVFVVKERVLQQNDQWRALFYRLLDYRIVHNCATALTHKSQEGTFQAFAIDIGCYAHLRKLQGRFNEVDLSLPSSKEQMRSAPILDEVKMRSIFDAAPMAIEDALLNVDEAA